MLRTIKTLSLSSMLALALVACGSGAGSTTEGSTLPNPNGPTGPTTKLPSWENPGGMWQPMQMTAFADLLKKLGLEIDPALLADPSSDVLQSIVSLGGCSASFVSPDGLIITNHHCVISALSYHSTPEQDLTKTGYLAKTRGDELWNGPSAKVWVTSKMTDVSDKVLADLASLKDDKARYDAIESREKELVAGCEQDRPGIRCNVSEFFKGAQFLLMEQLELRDIRLVYAPTYGNGQFGGDTDNWMWPRQGADFGFLRAYVGPDGKPADHSDKNVPFKPAHFLKLASKPLAPGDLVMVAGFPGNTDRLATAAETDEAVSWAYPRQIAQFEAYLAPLKALGDKDKDAAVKAQSTIFGFENYLKNNKGMIEGLTKGGVAAAKRQLETELKTWVQADATRQQQYGDVFDKLAALEAEHIATRDRDAALGEIGFARLYGVASLIVRMAEERPKQDADRDPMFQARNWARMEARLVDFPKKYNQLMDRTMFTVALTRAASDAKNADWLGVIFGKGKKIDGAAIEAKLTALYGKSQLENDKTRLDLWKQATTAQLKKSKDPMIQLALVMRPLEKEVEDRGKKYEGAMAMVTPRYIALVRAHHDGPLAPDANGTLRLTFGTVRGYQPDGAAAMYFPMTKLSEALAKNKGAGDFDLSPAWLAAYQAKKFGPYVDATLGEVPVNFLSDCDITGGNSGSATLNSRGELTGLAFDGNIESMASDWVFLPKVTRSIHVDIRYVEWIMDAVDGAHDLLKEMGVTPSI